MPLSIRVCSEADVDNVESLQWPELSDRRRLFGITHAGALLETSLVTLCAIDTNTNRVVGFAAFDDHVPAALLKWPEATEYLKKKVMFGRPNGCILLSAFAQDPTFAHAWVVTELLHHLFTARPQVGGVVLPVPMGVDIEELHVFYQAFSCYDPISLSTGALFRFYRAVRVDYTPCVYIRLAQPTDARPLHGVLENQQMEWRLQDGASYRPWFDAHALPQFVSTQDAHHACFVAHSLVTNAPAGVLACSDAIPEDKVETYSKLFAELYRHRTGPGAPASTTATTTAGTIMTASASSSMAVSSGGGGGGGYGATGPPRIIVCGPTGSGKRTQCELLVAEFDVVHVSSGSMLRHHIQEGTALGLQAQTYLDAGDLVPDELLLDMVLKRLADADCQARGWVLNGFPRTEMQARVLVAQGIVPDVLVVMSLAEDEVLRRLSGRRHDPETGRAFHVEFDPPPPELAARVVHRREDHEDRIRRRLVLYHEHIEAVFQVFMKTAKICHLDGARSKESIARKIIGDVYLAKKLRRPFRVRHVPKLVIAGPPAGGKGTQCEWLVRAFNVVHLSTGDMLRAAIAAHSPLGLAAKAFMDAGELVPDELIVDVLLRRLAEPDCTRQGWLLDGFPRTRAQAQVLVAKGIVPDAMLILEVPDDEIVARISGRVTDPLTGRSYHLTANPPPPEVAERCTQRSDDTAETVRVRLATYHANCDEVRGALGGVTEVLVVDGTLPIETIAERFVGAVERLLLRNNCFLIDLFAMELDYECRAQQFLTKAFQSFHDKDCVLLALPEGCGRPMIATGFRAVRADPRIPTIARLQRRATNSNIAPTLAAGATVAKAPPKRQPMVLYAFHRDELPFLSFSGSELLSVEDFDADDDDDQAAKARGAREAEAAALVPVKGLGVWGISQLMKSWTTRAWGGLRGAPSTSRPARPERTRGSLFGRSKKSDGRTASRSNKVQNHSAPAASGDA